MINRTINGQEYERGNAGVRPSPGAAKPGGCRPTKVFSDRALVPLRVLPFVAILYLLLGNVIPAVAGPAPALSDWMAPLAGTKHLSEFSIPGSHDSCALYETWPHTARCQSLTIPEQLAAGVRFLDIRCRHMNDSFQIFHGSANQRISFATVLTNCRGFLQLHPAECIIMSVKEEYTAENNTRSFEETFDTYAKTNADKWFLKGDLPTLGEARGKLILFRRFTAAGTPKGIDASRWPDNRDFWIGGGLRVQDDYVVKDKQAKWAAIESLYHEAATGKPDVLHVNFASGYEPETFGIPSINAVSDYVNPKLIDFFQHAPAGRFGVTLMDFAEAQKCALIVGTNR